MPAELVRDQALAASGLLVQKIGGPSVYPVSAGGDLEPGQHEPPISGSGDAAGRRSAPPKPVHVHQAEPPSTRSCSSSIFRIATLSRYGGRFRTRRCRRSSCSTIRSSSRPIGCWRRNVLHGGLRSRMLRSRRSSGSPRAASRMAEELDILRTYYQRRGQARYTASTRRTR